MSMFIKVSKDGKYLYFVKTLFSNVISESEFIERANMISTDEFLGKYSGKLDETTKNKINRVKQIADVKLSALGCTETLYFAGDEIFDSNNCDNPREEALGYAKRFYGMGFTKDKLDLINSKEITCFSGKTQISFDEYKSLMKELEELTQITCLKKENVKKSLR